MSDFKIGQKGIDKNGMGGIFPVKIIHIDEDKGVKVRVTQKGWTNITYYVNEDRARSIFGGE